MVTLQFGAFSGLILLCSLLSVRAGPHNVTIDDTDSSFNYTSSPAWDTIVWDQQSPQPLNGTNHGSTSPGAEVTFKFTGTAFYMYGYKWSDHGFRTITVDGTRTIQCDGRQGEQGSRSLIFSRENLTYTEHTVVIENTGTQGQYINIDYAIITQNDTLPTNSGGSTASSSAGLEPTSTTPTSSSNKKPFPIAAVAGAAGGGIVFSVLLLAVILLWRCKLRKRRARRGTVSAGANYHRKMTVSAVSLHNTQAVPYSPSSQVTPSSYTPMSPSAPYQQFSRHQSQRPSLSNVRSVGSFQHSLSESSGYSPRAIPRMPQHVEVQQHYNRGFVSTYPDHRVSIPSQATSSIPSTPTTGLVQLGYTAGQHNQYIHYASEKARCVDERSSSAAGVGTVGPRSVAGPSRTARESKYRDTRESAPPQYTLTP